jgi:hypothetical protein
MNKRCLISPNSAGATTAEMEADAVPGAGSDHSVA